MSDFKIGEVVVYVRPGSPHFGQETTIIGNWVDGAGIDHITGQPYRGTGRPCFAISLDHPSGGKLWALPEWLQKKRPPQREQDQIVSWDDCLWKPKDVVTA